MGQVRKSIEGRCQKFWLSTRMFYGGEVVNGPGTNVSDRPRSVKVKGYFKKHFRVDSPLVTLNVEEESHVDSTSFLYNMESASAIITLITDMIQDGIVDPTNKDLLVDFQGNVAELATVKDPKVRNFLKQWNKLTDRANEYEEEQVDRGTSWSGRECFFLWHYEHGWSLS